VADVLLGQSYFLRFDPKLWEQMQPYPPLGTLYAAAVLREEGRDVAVFDAMLAASEDEWAAVLDRERPSIAAIYEDSFNYLSKMCLVRMREAAFTMTRMARERGCRVVVSGSDATDHAAAYLEHGADVVILGEGDLTLAEVVAAFGGDGSAADLSSVAGVAYRAPDGAVVTTPRRPDLRDLDRLPFPARDLVDLERYRAIWHARQGRFSLNLATTRGCPFHCNWCAKPIWGQRYNVRSPENVVAEMLHLKRTWAPDHLWIVDDIMGLRPGWLARFADAVVEHDARIPFKCLGRADLLLRPGDIEALARAGAETVWIGAESGSQRILDAMDKGTTVEQIREVSVRLRAAGVRVGFFLQFGYPGESREDIEATIALVTDCLPDDIGVSVSYPLPGTPFHARVREQLGAQQNWRDSDDLAMLYRGPFTTAFYRQLHQVVHAEFRARRASHEVARAVRHPASLRPVHARRLGAAVWHRARLPLLRARLDGLARVPHAASGSLGPGLGREAAATPSPRSDGAD
jgi:anaerobic magnesium-protoporphyrin IX monomethyl ester cyclase